MPPGSETNTGTGAGRLPRAEAAPIELPVLGGGQGGAGGAAGTGGGTVGEAVGASRRLGGVNDTVNGLLGR